MATTLDEMRSFLDEYDLKYRVDETRNAILISFGCEEEESGYRDDDGDAHVRLVIQLSEEGGFVAVFAPNAWNIDDCPNKAAVFEALASIQSQYKMVRFDYDPTDGEIRPNMEHAVEDSSMTSRQLHRMIQGMLGVIHRFHPVIKHAMDHGEVSFASLQDEERSSPPSEETSRLMDLARRAGGIEALEKLLGGAPPGEGDPPAESDAA